MSTIIALDAISLFLSLLIFSYAHSMRSSFRRLIRPVLVVFYAVGILAIGMAFLEILGFLVPDESVTSIVLHFVILFIMVFVVVSLNHMRVSALQGKLDQTRALNRLKAEFLARTSHELKTPITPLIMQLQLLQRERFGKISKQQAESLEMIERNIKRLSHLINDILFYSKTTAGKVKLEKEKVDLNKLISQAVETMQAKVKKNNSSVSFKQGKLPKIQADPARLTQVLVNLLDNAIKFSGKNGKVWIETDFRRPDVQVLVKDNGPGIREEDMPKLFQPFTQFSNVSTRKYGGTGIGLSICRSLVELHKGKIWAKRAGEGLGVSFYFSLPIKGK